MKPHPKVRIPEGWARFHGVSLIFSEFGDVPLFGEDAALKVRGILDDPVLAEHSFRPLPPETYHVTLADLIHDGLTDLPPEVAVSGEGRVDIPGAAEILAPHLQDSELLAPGAVGLDLEFSAVTYFQGRALAVVLKPTEQSADLYRSLDQRRGALLEGAAHLGVARSAWKPHVTLGYFAYPELGKQAADRHLADLAAAVGAALHATRIHVSEPHLFGFVDMQTFNVI